MIPFILVILFTALAEALCTWYIQSVNNNRAVVASLLCGLNMLVSKAITIETVRDQYLLAAVFVGAFIGTYLSVKFQRKK